MQIESKTLPAIRSDVCNAMLLWLSGGALLILIVAVVNRPAFIPGYVLVLASGLVAIVNLFALFRHRLPFVARAGLIVAMALVAGMGKALLYGAPYGFLDLALTVVMAAALFGERAGIVASLGCIAALGAVYFGFSHGFIPPPATQPPPLAGSTWLLGIVMLAVTTFGPLIVISRLAQHVDLERQRAQEASDAKSTFLAMMSHELRTPLNAIMGFSEAMSMDYAGPPGAPRYREYAGDIHHSAAHLLAIVDDLLNLARTEVRQLSAAVEPLDVASEMKRASATMEALARKAGLTLRLQLADGLPPMMADPKLVQQIMLNLLSNATKFTPAGGTVTISARNAGDRVHIAVTDTGVGIPADEIPHLGQPFRQAKHGVPGADGGAGLGLALAKTFTELQHGEFDIRSTVGIGTTIEVRLPVASQSSRSSTGGDL